MDQTSCSKTIIPAIIQNDVARDLILLNAYEETCCPLILCKRKEVIVMEKRDARDGAVLTAVSEPRSLLTAMN